MFDMLSVEHSPMKYINWVELFSVVHEYRRVSFLGSKRTSFAEECFKLAKLCT